jgi:hypothetical protein
MQAMLRIGINAILLFRLMFKPLIRKIGSRANVKSQAADTTLMMYVNATMKSMLMHVPTSPRARLQKYGTGLH